METNSQYNKIFQNNARPLKRLEGLYKSSVSVGTVEDVQAVDFFANPPSGFDMHFTTPSKYLDGTDIHSDLQNEFNIINTAQSFPMTNEDPGNMIAHYDQYLYDPRNDLARPYHTQPIMNRNIYFGSQYDDDGFPKRTVGVFYPDMGCVYTREMLNSDRGIVDNDRKTKRKRNKRSVAGQKKK